MLVNHFVNTSDKLSVNVLDFIEIWTIDKYDRRALVSGLHLYVVGFSRVSFIWIYSISDFTLGSNPEMKVQEGVDKIFFSGTSLTDVTKVFGVSEFFLGHLVFIFLYFDRAILYIC